MTTPPLNSHAAAALELNARMSYENEIEALRAKIAQFEHEKTENDRKAREASISPKATPRSLNDHNNSGTLCDEDDDEDGDDISSATSNRPRAIPRLKLSPPPMFTMKLKEGEALIDKLEELDVFICKFSIYYRAFERNERTKLSIKEQIEHMMNYVDNQVFKSILAVEKRLSAGNTKIESIEQLFQDIVQICQGSEMDTAAQLDEIKQLANEKVESYFLRFDHLINRAINEDVATREVAVLWFINGLKHDIGRQVKLDIKARGLVQGTTSIKSALSKCFTVAKAYETDLLTNDRGGWRSRQQSSTNQSVNPSNNQSNSYNRVNKGTEAPLSRDEKIKLVMKKYSMTASEVERHWSNGLCFACHSNKHSANDASCPMRKGRLNMTHLNANDQLNDSNVDSKNE